MSYCVIATYLLLFFCILILFYIVVFVGLYFANRLDVDSLRERNHDLREQLSELNMKYFEMVLAGRNKNKNRGDNRMKNSPRISQNVDASLTEDNSSSDDDNEFQDTVPNVEDAYAIKSHSKSSTGRKPISNFLSSDASSSADDKASHEVLEPVGHSLTPDEVTELRNTLNLYEKQFDLMKVCAFGVYMSSSLSNMYMISIWYVVSD
mgnify:CR=1 FL=1